MKYLFFYLLFLGVTASSLGVSADNADPIVNGLRQEFKSATTPTEADLKLGQYWYCSGFSAVTDHDGGFTDVKSYNFEKTSEGSYDGQVTPPTQFMFVGENLVGRLKSPANDDVQNRVYYFVRKTKRGELIMEEALTKKKGHFLKGPTSVVDSDAKVGFYILCSVK